jgi:hypothetical protein
MHAVLVTVTINDQEPALENLRGEVVPQVSQAPGFVAGYWMRADDGGKGTGVIVFESEDAARAVEQRVQEQTGTRDYVSLDNVEVREVVANA